MNDKSTCWYDPMCHEEMIKGAKGELWPVLEKSSHWPVLKELLKTILALPRSWKELIDIGCGAGCLGSTALVKAAFKYTGVDIPQVINNVAKKANPDNFYIGMDLVERCDYSFVSEYDVVVMNAFIDIMHDPINVLIDIIDNCTKYVIIHRQFVIGGPTKVKKASSYGGETYISHINEIEFNTAIKHFKVLRRLDTGLGNNNYSYLLERFKD